MASGTKDPKFEIANRVAQHLVKGRNSAGRLTIDGDYVADGLEGATRLTTKVGGDVSTPMTQKRGWAPGKVADEAEDVAKAAKPEIAKSAAPVKAPQEKNMGVFATIDTYVANPVSTAMGYGSMYWQAEMLLPIAAGAVGLIHKGTSEKMMAPINYINETKIGTLKTKIPEDMRGKQYSWGRGLSDGLSVGFQTMSTYAVASSYIKQLGTLKKMYSDITGVPENQVATGTVLFGKIPAVMQAARSHFLKEHIARGLVNAVGLGLIIRAVRTTGTGFWSGMAPSLVGSGIDYLMGESLLSTYGGFSEAVESGQAVPPEAYGAFLISNSPELQKRGRMGERVAMALGATYAEMKATPVMMLKEMEGGLQSKYSQRVTEVIAKMEAAKAAQATTIIPEQKRGRAPREAQGKFTHKIIAEEKQPGHGAAITAI
jgi:hypothetical protein